MSGGKVRTTRLCAWSLLACIAVKLGGVQFVLPSGQPRSSATRLNSWKIQDMVSPEQPKKKDDVPPPDAIFPNDVKAFSLVFAAGAVAMLFSTAPALAQKDYSHIVGVPSLNTRCDARKPVVGEKVKNETGVHLEKEHFKLKDKAVATVAAVDETGDFKLRNRAGSISDWLCRKQFAYLGSTV